MDGKDLTCCFSYATTGTYARGNFIEIWADLEDGGYDDDCLEVGAASK
jgi:hypothetical protein